MCRWHTGPDPHPSVNDMERLGRNTLLCSCLLIASLLVSFGCLAFPLYVIRPFRYQGSRELAAALAILHVRPFIETSCVILALGSLARYWRLERRRSRHIWAVVGVSFVCAFAALSHVNVYELMFRPIGHPAFMAIHDVKIDGDEEVIAVKLGGKARAYPIRSISYHHVVNDLVGQVAVVATY